jgi:hypothetical protein
MTARGDRESDISQRHSKAMNNPVKANSLEVKAMNRRIHPLLGALVLVLATGLGAPLALGAAMRVIDDFEDADLSPQWGHSWIEVNDKPARGTSRASLEVVESGAEKSKKALHVTGTVTSAFQHGYAGASLQFNEAKEGQSVREHEGVRFFARGDGNLYEFQALTTSVGDNNWYRTEFVPTQEWTLYEFPFENLAQSPYWGKKVKWTGKDVYGFSFQTAEGPHEKFWIEIDQLAFY